MNNDERNDIAPSRDDSPEAGLRALKRARERAWERARAAGTPLVYEPEGKLIYVDTCVEGEDQERRA